MPIFDSGRYVEVPSFLTEVGNLADFLFDAMFPHGFAPGGLLDYSLEVQLSDDYVRAIGFSLQAIVERTANGLTDELIALGECDEVSEFTARFDSNGVMVFCSAGSPRLSATGLFATIFSHAALKTYLLNTRFERAAYRENCMNGAKQLLGALAGDTLSAIDVHGLPLVDLDHNQSIQTEFGLLLTGPRVGVQSLFHLPTVSSLLLPPQRSLKVSFDFQAIADVPTHASYRHPPELTYQFGLACALTRTEGYLPIAPRPKWTLTLLPFGPQTALRRYPPLQNKHHPVNFTQHAAELVRWCRSLAQLDGSTIDVAMKSVASALSHRSDSRDSLLDAIVCWEALFGAKGETVFRVTSALSKIIEPDPKKRIALRKKLAKLYGTRSDLVHGRKQSISDIEGAANSAIDYGIQALRIILQSPKLLCAADSERRGEMLLLEYP